MNQETIDEAAARQEANANLPQRKCPACGKDCSDLKRGPGGWFRACPDYPRCPGKAVTLSAHQRQAMRRKLQASLSYIRQVGGVDEAEFWLRQAAEIVRHIDPKQSKKKDGAR